MPSAINQALVEAEAVQVGGLLGLPFPSKSEGFGFTVAKAMSHGVPVIAAYATCLPEVVGDAGLLVDAELRQSLSEAGFRRAADFSWTRAAEQTPALCRQALLGV